VTEQAILDLLARVFGQSQWPTAVRFLEAIYSVHSGRSVADAAKQVGSSAKKIQSLLDQPEPAFAALGIESGTVDEVMLRSTHKALGQMVLGRCAEMVFKARYQSEMETEELQLTNVAGEGSDTDYRLIDGQGRYLFRINIKFHGSLFRQAKEWVGLEPENCFALATYKIKSALEKQDEEKKPYFFAIVGVPNLTAEVAGRRFDSELVDASALILGSKVTGKRKFEDAIVDYAVASVAAAFRDTYAAIENADWYILSARRADQLLHKFLFERVLALKVRNFTRMFRGAEVDMHFSISEDLIPLSQFFEHLREGGVVKVSTLLERGEL
jgi:hypothetical protein